MSKKIHITDGLGQFLKVSGRLTSEFPDATEFSSEGNAVALASAMTRETGIPFTVVADYGFADQRILKKTARIAGKVVVA